MSHPTPEQDLVRSLRASLEQAQAEAAQAHQEKAKFVSVVTHELRIPLTSIKGYTDLLRQGVVGPLNEQQINFLNVIRNNVDRMSALISDLADISHLQSGRLKLQPQLVDIKAELEAFCALWQPRLAEKKQTFQVEIAPRLPLLQLDRSRFNQILGYLLSNAQRYTPAEGKISLRAWREGDFLRVEVQDSGIGIQAADQARVFEAFFRSEDPAVRESPGWGLSLHVAKNLVELMGGQIGFTSQPQAGSTFWFSVPVLPPA